ncbi:MAG: oxidoreductase, partial [Proteobacteria bacterium]|nr:oxidoreductase [Pseudomonadota bacterium]
ASGKLVGEPMTDEDIADTIEAFAKAAAAAKEIGFDCVELHGAHGYLMSEFLSAHANTRTDGYGGSLEKRMRFPLEIFEATRQVWPADRPLGIRISASEYADGGWSIADAIIFVTELKRLGCDFVDVSGGGVVAHQKIPLGPGYQVPFAEAIKRATGMVTMTVGMITEPRQAEAILAEGKADLVALGRAFLRNPRWVWDAADALGGEAFCPPQFLRGRTTPLPQPAARA